MRHIPLLVGTLCMLSVCASCKKHPTPEQAKVACEHQIELGFWNGFKKTVTKAGLDPNAPDIKAKGEKGLAEQQKSKEWQAQLDKCTQGFARLASVEQINCIDKATTTDAAQACVKAK